MFCKQSGEIESIRCLVRTIVNEGVSEFYDLEWFKEKKRGREKWKEEIEKK